MPKPLPVPTMLIDEPGPFDTLAEWESHLLGIVEPRPANVVPFEKAAAT